MSLTITDGAELAFLDLILGVDYTLHLFTNDLTGATKAQLDALEPLDMDEPTFPGYAAVALTGGAWTTTFGHPSEASYAQQTFTRTSTGTAELVHGYYVTETATGELRWLELFDPIVMEFTDDAINITPRITLDDTEGSPVQTGTITAYGGSSAPSGYLLCDGSAVSRTTYDALFAILGTTYGAGDGSTTFNLPDLRQRFPIGKGASGTGSTLGAVGGSVDHVHGLDTASSGALTRLNAASQTLRANLKSVATWAETDSVTTTAGIANAGGLTTAARLTGDSDTENPPYQVVNYIVKT